MNTIMDDKKVKNIFEINGDTASCDGGEVGHPMVYFPLPKNTKVSCPYCGNIFIQKLE